MWDLAMPTSDGSLRDVEDSPQKSLCASSAILSFASLDICTCPVEYYESFV
jgi:hypothetical protein